jgi:hypothetical protein
MSPLAYRTSREHLDDLRAAFLAAADGRQIGTRHLLRAATAEYASMGKVMTHGGARGLG